MKERRKSLLSNEKMISYTVSSIGSTHKQHTHHENTENYFKIKRRQDGVGKMEVLFK